MTKEESFETAIVDGINIYVREALKPNGFLNLEKVGAIACEELVKLKYQIAHGLASKWAKLETET